MKAGGGYVVPTSKPFTLKRDAKSNWKMSSHRKAVKAFCSSHDISFGKDKDGGNLYIITEKESGKKIVGKVIGDE